MEVAELRANPGGTLAPEEIIGRDAIVDRLWAALRQQSLVLTSERRIGKTSVVTKMISKAPPRTHCIVRDLEGLRSPAEFVEAIYHDATPVLSKVDRARLGMWRLFTTLGGAELGDLKLPAIAIHWKNLLDALVKDLCEMDERRIVFLWDELPLFLYDIAESGGGSVAMEVLDVLRALRQRYRGLRMVFTGSVGIHEVIGSLRRAGYANDPTNDMRMFEVPPLTPADGTLLAKLLLRGERIEIVGVEADVCGFLSESVAHIPFYIHSLVARIKEKQQTLALADVTNHVQGMVSDPDDPAHFSHYSQRLLTHCGDADAQTALVVLDTLAQSGVTLRFAELLNLAKHRIPLSNEEAFRRILTLLLRNHYLIKFSDGTYAFRYSIVKSWWQHARG